MSPIQAESILLSRGFSKRNGFPNDHVYVRQNRVITFVIMSNALKIGLIREMEQTTYDEVSWGEPAHCKTLTEAIDRAILEQDIDWEFVNA